MGTIATLGAAAVVGLVALPCVFFAGMNAKWPLGVEPADVGFVIALVCGNDAQWLRNLLTTGHAEVARDDVTYAVERPEVVPGADVIGWFAPSDRSLVRLFGVDRCLRLYHAAHD